MNRTGQQLRPGLELAQLRAVSQQRVNHVGDLMRGGLVPADQQRHAQEQQLGLGQPVLVIAGLDEPAEQVIAGPRAALREQVGQIPGQLQVRVLHLPGAGRRGRHDGIGPAAEDMPVGVGDAEQLADDDRGEDE
jgi:hypothetical protein